MYKSILSELRLYFCNEWLLNIPSHSVRNLFYRKAMKFKMGTQSTILMHCTFDAAKAFSMGDYSVINANCRLDTRGGIFIGNNVSISNNVMILTADHDMDDPSFKGRTRKVIIEDYVWVGTRALILPGVTLGIGSVVAAGSVVTKDVLPYMVVAGIPAKVIKKRNDVLNYRPVYFRKFH